MRCTITHDASGARAPLSIDFEIPRKNAKKLTLNVNSFIDEVGLFDDFIRCFNALKSTSEVRKFIADNTAVFVSVSIGVGDGGRGGVTCPLKFGKKYFSSNYYVKFGHF